MLRLRLQMNTEDILKAIDGQLALLQQARGLLAGSPAPKQVTTRRGRPKGSKNKTAAAPAPAKAAKRVMSAEGKARIAAAQKLRWAAQKTTAETPVKPAAKKSTPSPSKKAAAKSKVPQKQAAKKTAAVEA